MFNQPLKEQFISFYTTSANVADVCVCMFDTIEKYEVEFGGDICTMDTEAVQPIINKLAGMRSGHQTRIYVLMAYAKWCIENHVNGACDGILKAKVSGFEKIKTQTVRSPLHLQTYLDAVFDKENEETIGNIFRCFLWLAYAGMEERDIVLVRSSDVDFSKMSVHYRGDDYPIYREAILCFDKCVNLTSFVYKHPNYSKTVHKPRAGGDALLRGFNTTAAIASIRTSISRMADRAAEKGKTSIRLSYYRVWLSGVFYRMYEREMAGFKPDFSGICYYPMGRESRRSLYAQNRIASEYMQDYELWKKTFGS